MNPQSSSSIRSTGAQTPLSFPLRTPRVFYVGIVLYAILTCLLGSPNLSNDSGQYFNYANFLLTTRVYGQKEGIPDADREPGYGAFLALARAPVEIGAKVIGVNISTPFLLKWFVFWQAFLGFAMAALAAFCTSLPRSVGRIFFAILVLSPTVWGTHSVIYSETLAISLLLFFLWALDRAVCDAAPKSAILAGAAWGMLALTKGYFELASTISFALASVCFVLGRPTRMSRCHSALILLGTLVAITMQSAWSFRNRFTLGPNMATPRIAYALAGKVLRAETFVVPRELPIALSAAIGTNLCNRLYSETACLKYEIRGSDQLGIAAWAKYKARMPTPAEAQKALVHDMIIRYFDHPGLQIFATLLEVVRMSFFEAPQSIQSGVGALDMLPRVWHFAGSILAWVVAWAGFFAIRRQNMHSKLACSHLWIFCGVLVLYHYVVMSQTTNLVRYIYPVLPAIYLYCAFGWRSIRSSLRNLAGKHCCRPTSSLKFFE